jgi:hypothetical protein
MTKPGLYKHKGGNFYVVEGTVKESSNAFEAERESRLKVLYWSLEHGPGDKNVRYEDEFHEEVEWPDGKRRPRFVRLSAIPI